MKLFDSGHYDDIGRSQESYREPWALLAPGEAPKTSPRRQQIGGVLMLRTIACPTEETATGVRTKDR